MKKLPLPLEIVKGRYPIVTQEYGDQSNVAWYKANGVNIDAHNGTDIVISGGDVATYGTKLIAPVKCLRNKVWFTDPMSTQGNGVKVQWSNELGQAVKMTVWHCSECVNQEEYKKGDTLGYIGNSGLVSPAPTFFGVHKGAHLHLMTYINDVLTNPREVFDFNKWTVSETDTSKEKDLPPFQYFLNKISQSISALTLKK